MTSTFRRQPARFGQALAASMLLATGAHAQTSIYRCTDGNGHVAYQSVPCAGSGNGKQLDTGAAGRAPAPRPVATSTPPPSADTAARANARGVEPTQGPQGTQTWGVDADVIVVSGYQFSAGITQVHVNHPARPVLLVLTGYNKTEWKVLPAPGTRIKAIVAAAASDGPPLVQPLPQVPVAYDDLPYATETGNVKFRQLIGKLHTRYGVNKVTGFRGGYQLPAVVPVSGPFAPDPNLSLDGLRPEVPRVQFSFDLLSTDGRRLPWTNTGPKDGKRYMGVVRGGGPFSMQRGGPAAMREDGREAYALEGNGSTLMWFPQGFNGPSQKVTLPTNMPPLSWGSGMVWDARRNVLAIVSFGGEGHFYRYDTRARQWLGARSLQNRDLFSLAQDPASGRYFSVSDKAELIVFNENGELEEVQPLARLLPGLDSTYDRGNERMHGLSVAAGPGVVAILNIRDAAVTHIWTYELGSRKGQLTYKMAE